MKEGDDYYISHDGLFVLTEKYLLQRNQCCGNGCRHCPYNYQHVPEPKRSSLLKFRHEEKKDQHEE